MMAGTALEGVRVLDLADESGAYCGKLLADMGADVILIEPPGGVRMRTIGPFYRGVQHPDRSLFFWHYNANKRSVSLDVRTADGRQRFMDLVTGADVVVDTSPPGHLDALGLGYATLTAGNPRVTLASITPFGQSGPCRTHRGSDLVCQAVGGGVFVNGWPDEPPLQGLGLQAYHSAALHAASAIVLALLARTRTGRGQQIDVSIQACVAACVEHVSATYHTIGTVAHRQGTLHWTRHFRVGRCRDGDVLHGTLGDWTALLEWLKGDGMAADLGAPEWADAGYRRDHSAHLFTVLDAWARTHTVEDLVNGAQMRRLPYAEVRSPDALCDDPQLRARGFFAAIEHDELSTSITYPGAPYIFSATPWRLRRRPPRSGEHTDAVMAEAADRAVRTAPRASAPAPAPGPGMRPLDGIRVIDFTWVAAGPVATRILADHGADVIKVERPDTPMPTDGPGGVLGNLNRGKRSIVVDMNTADGIDVARRLLARADVVIDNFSPRVLPNWGLDWPALQPTQSPACCRQHVRVRPQRPAARPCQLRTNVAGAGRVHAPDAPPRGCGGRLGLFVLGHGGGPPRGARRVAGVAPPRAKRPRAVDRSIAVRSPRQPGRSGPARHPHPRQRRGTGAERSGRRRRVGGAAHRRRARQPLPGAAGGAARRIPLRRRAARPRALVRTRGLRRRRVVAVLRCARPSAMGARHALRVARARLGHRACARRARERVDAPARCRGDGPTPAGRRPRGGHRRRRSRPLPR